MESAITMLFLETAILALFDALLSILSYDRKRSTVKTITVLMISIKVIIVEKLAEVLILALFAIISDYQFLVSNL
jgi:hypothetical protein